LKKVLDKYGYPCYNKDTKREAQTSKRKEIKIMIIATILNTKTKEYKEIQFSSLESAGKIITSINEHKPEIGFLMLIDWEEA
jgi:hypothetical protein